MNTISLLILAVLILAALLVRERSLRKNEEAKKVVNDKLKDVEDAISASAAAIDAYERLRTEYNKTHVLPERANPTGPHSDEQSSD